MLDLMCFEGRLFFVWSEAKSQENLLSVKEGCHSSPQDHMDGFLGLEKVGAFVSS